MLWRVLDGLKLMMAIDGVTLFGEFDLLNSSFSPVFAHFCLWTFMVT